MISHKVLLSVNEEWLYVRWANVNNIVDGTIYPTGDAARTIRLVCPVTLQMARVVSDSTYGAYRSNWRFRLSVAAVPILFASRSTFQERNSSRSIVALIPKARMCIFGCFYLTVYFKLLVFYRIARARITFRILNSLLMTAVLTMEGI